MSETNEIDVGRANAYRLLADCYQMPETLNLETIGELATIVEWLYPEGDETVQSLLQAWPHEDDARNDMREAHTKLFIGPCEPQAPPIGSVYLDEENQLKGDSTMDAMRYYEKAGLDPNREVPTPPDHITTELGFMHYLANQQLTLDDPLYRELQRGFLVNHLSQWIPLFSARVLTGDLHLFYNQLALLTSIAVHADTVRFGVYPHIEKAYAS